MWCIFPDLQRSAHRFHPEAHLLETMRSDPVRFGGHAAAVVGDLQLQLTICRGPELETGSTGMFDDVCNGFLHRAKHGQGGIRRNVDV